LAEKQKAKEIYGLRERQFANYVRKAVNKVGDTGLFLLAFLNQDWTMSFFGWVWQNPVRPRGKS